MKYLVIETTYFVDPHGSADKGNVKKFITNNGNYENTPEWKYFDGEEYIDEDDLRGSEDGYNRKVYRYTMTPLSIEEAEHVQAIINAYASL